jgi:Fic family protein
MCSLINARDDGFEKALLAVVLISYIQPFEDGNKRGKMSPFKTDHNLIL